MPVLWKGAEMSEDQANAIVYRLIEEDCFADGGRLVIYPNWLKDEHMQALISVGVFRREPGNMENLMHETFYINPCCEKIGLSSDCTWPNCMHFHFQKSGLIAAPSGLRPGEDRV
jgi:hypothetical protein